MKYLVRYTCADKSWAAITMGGGAPEQVVEYHHHGDPFTIESVTEVPAGMLVYSVTSQLNDSIYSTDVFVAQNVEDAARQTREHWAAELCVGRIMPDEITIHKVEPGENPCPHLEGTEEDEG